MRKLASGGCLPTLPPNHGKVFQDFYLGTLLMSEATSSYWAIYVWCRRTDELVDGPGAAITTPETLDRWEAQLESLFAGRPFDDLDVALVDPRTLPIGYSALSGYDCRSTNGLVSKSLRDV